MSIPEGFKLVPADPTEEMLEVLHRNVKIQVDTWERTADIINDKEWWAAVVESAPNPPQPIYDEAKERELFEAWAYSVRHVPYGWLGREYFKRMGDHYEDDYAHGLWQGWKARAKSVEVGDE